MDFTLITYKKLLKNLKKAEYSFQTISQYLSASVSKPVVLRHDIDKLPLNALQFAKIESEMGIKGTYYFRIVTESFDEKIIKEIFSMGHEIGYHYEDLSFAWTKLKAQGSGLSAQGEELENFIVEIGKESFNENLAKLRKIVPVNTICMHGSPMSRWDSRLLWKYYDYHDFGVVSEPYFDINFNDVLYLTDTGRRWDGGLVSVRDKAQSSGLNAQGIDPFKDWKVKPKGIISHTSSAANGNPYDLQPVPITQHPAKFPKFHSSSDIIKAAEANRLPDKIMMTFHPQRWTDKPLPWVKELVWQNVKNVGKYFLIKLRG
jgi:hypothetical protein